MDYIVALLRFRCPCHFRGHRTHFGVELDIDVSVQSYEN